MNKTDLVTKVAERAGFTKKDTEKLIDHLLGCIGDAMVDREKLQIVGFGTFEVKHRDARLGRNPQTGGEVQIAASDSVGFKPSKTLKDLLNK